MNLDTVEIYDDVNISASTSYSNIQNSPLVENVLIHYDNTPQYTSDINV